MQRVRHLRLCPAKLTHWAGGTLRSARAVRQSVSEHLARLLPDRKSATWTLQAWHLLLRLCPQTARRCSGKVCASTTRPPTRRRTPARSLLSPGRRRSSRTAGRHRGSQTCLRSSRLRSWPQCAPMYLLGTLHLLRRSSTDPLSHALWLGYNMRQAQARRTQCWSQL